MTRESGSSQFSQASAFLGAVFMAALASVLLLMGSSTAVLEPVVIRAALFSALALTLVLQASRDQSIAARVQFALVRQRFIPRKYRIQVNDPLLL